MSSINPRPIIPPSSAIVPVSKLISPATVAERAALEIDALTSAGAVVNASEIKDMKAKGFLNLVPSLRENDPKFETRRLFTGDLETVEKTHVLIGPDGWEKVKRHLKHYPAQDSTVDPVRFFERGDIAKVNTSLEGNYPLFKGNPLLGMLADGSTKMTPESQAKFPAFAELLTQVTDSQVARNLFKQAREMAIANDETHRYAPVLKAINTLI